MSLPKHTSAYLEKQKIIILCLNIKLRQLILWLNISYIYIYTFFYKLVYIIYLENTYI